MRSPGVLWSISVLVTVPEWDIRQRRASSTRDLDALHAQPLTALAHVLLALDWAPSAVGAGRVHFSSR